jgi:hypothetical protein
MSPDWKKWKEGNYSSDNVFEWPLTFKYRGEFDYDGLMNVIRSYYAKVKIDKLDEPKFKYKVGGGGKAEVEFKFKGDMKVTGFTKMLLKVEGHLWNVVRDKPSNGKVEIKIEAGFIYDYGKGFAPENKTHRWMLEKVTQPKKGKGIAFGDLKAEGKKNAENTANGLLTEIKSFIGVECV